MKTIIGLCLSLLIGFYTLGQKEKSPILIIKESKILYSQTGNFITIVSENTHGLMYKANGAKVIQMENEGEIALIPFKNSNNVILTVFKNTKKIGVLHFEVINTPNPKIEIHSKHSLTACPKNFGKG